MKTIVITPQRTASIRTLVITVILVIITFACAAAVHGIDYSADNSSLSARGFIERFFDSSVIIPNGDPLLSVREISESLNDNPPNNPLDILSDGFDLYKADDHYYDVRIGGFDLPDPKVPDVTLQPRMITFIDSYIANLSTEDVMIEIEQGTGMIMLNRDSNGQPVEPYAAPKDMYSIGFQVVPNQNILKDDHVEYGYLVYDTQSASLLSNYVFSIQDSLSDSPTYLEDPIFFMKSLGDGTVGDRYFLSMPATGDYYVMDESFDRVTNDDGSYKTQLFECRVGIRMVVDLLKHAGAMGKEWEGAVLIPPRLTIAPNRPDCIRDILGLTQQDVASLVWAGDLMPPITIEKNLSYPLLYNSPYLDISRTSNAPFICITSQPAVTTTVKQGDINESLSVSAFATCNSVLAYQWYSIKMADTASAMPTPGATEMPIPDVSAVPIPGATDRILSIPDDLTYFNSRPYYFYCIISTADGSDSVMSAIATVNVLADSPVDNIVELNPSVASAPAGTKFIVQASLKTGFPFDRLADLRFSIQFDSDIIRLDDIKSLTGNAVERQGGNDVVLNGFVSNARECDLVLLTFTVLDDTKIGTIDLVNVTAKIVCFYRLDWFFLDIPYTVVPAVVNDNSA